MKWHTHNCALSFEKKTRALPVHFHIHGLFPSTKCQAKTYLQTYQLDCLKEWCIVGGIMAPSSAAQAIEGHHNCRYIHLHNTKNVSMYWSNSNLKI